MLICAFGKAQFCVDIFIVVMSAMLEHKLKKNINLIVQTWCGPRQTYSCSCTRMLLLNIRQCCKKAFSRPVTLSHCSYLFLPTYPPTPSLSPPLSLFLSVFTPSRNFLLFSFCLFLIRRATADCLSRHGEVPFFVALWLLPVP